MEETCVKEIEGGQRADVGLGELVRDELDPGERQSELKPVWVELEDDASKSERMQLFATT